jgi:hypothetical protein
MGQGFYSSYEMGSTNCSVRSSSPENPAPKKSLVMSWKMNVLFP